MKNHNIENYYILVAGDTDKQRLAKPSAYEVAIHRLKMGEWGIKLTTRNRKAFKQGDFALIYVSGMRQQGMHFIAKVSIASGAKPIPREHSLLIDAPRNEGIVLSELSIKFLDYDLFEKPVSMKGIKNKVKFIKFPNSNRWGCVLANGALRITKTDYDLIVESAKGEKHSH
jgi:hypothetical protein